MRTTWSRARSAGAMSVLLLAMLAGACGDDSADPGEDDPPSVAASPTSSAGGTGSPTPGPDETAPADGECSPPTADVTYSTGTATLVIANGPDTGTYELSTTPAKTVESAYQTGFGEQLVGNWRGTLEEQLPALEVRMLNQGDVCNGPPIVRIYLFGLAFEDNDSVACTAALSNLTTTAVSGSFDCTGIPRTFGSKEPTALDASGTFFLGA